jgi:DNA modification methylase
MEINKVYQGNSAELMKQLPDNFIDLTITSPPYDNLRDYKGYSFDFETIAKELFRITKEGGVVVWVVGDAVIKGSETGSSFKQALFFINFGFRLHDTMIYEKNGSSFPSRRDGNRYTQIFEYMFVFSKGSPKSVSLICDKENRWVGYTSFGKLKIRDKNGNLKEREMKPVPEFSPRNNIWRYSTGKNYSTKDEVAFQHPAIFPEQLAKDHIISWSNKGDLVFDPFAGSGTTLKMAMLNDRNYLGFEISAEYCALINKRIGINLSGFIRTSPKGDFSNEKEHNISLKESANTDSQISSNDETSLNNNIMFNLRGQLQSC